MGLSMKSGILSPLERVLGTKILISVKRNSNLRHIQTHPHTHLDNDFAGHKSQLNLKKCMQQGKQSKKSPEVGLTSEINRY